MENLKTDQAAIEATIQNYWLHHTICLGGIPGIFIRTDNRYLDHYGEVHSIIKIDPVGTRYSVTQLKFMKDGIIERHQWLAGYCYTIPGGISQIGGNKFLFLDPETSSLYLEYEGDGYGNEVLLPYSRLTENDLYRMP